MTQVFITGNKPGSPLTANTRVPQLVTNLGPGIVYVDYTVAVDPANPDSIPLGVNQFLVATGHLTLYGICLKGGVSNINVQPEVSFSYGQ